MTTEITEFRVHRDDLAVTEVATTSAAAGEGQVLCRIDRFALTANNITYAAHGVDMRYWDFYPAPAPWGVIPVWGFASVVQSNVRGVAVGERLYGYWPMASHAVLTPGDVNVRGFVDTAPRRSELAAVYNGYQRTTGDPRIVDERPYALFRPLYLTSFLLADVLPGDARLVLSSASSKTALGLAQTLAAQGTPPVGLTSAANVAFTTATGYYAQVLDYDAVASLPVGPPTVYADFSGDFAVREAVHEHLGETLQQSIVIGDTHWDVAGRGAALPGPKPEGFFAPTHLAIRLKDRAYLDRLTAGWAAFVASTAPWLRITEDVGAAAVTERYAALVAGRVDPAEGLILAL